MLPSVPLFRAGLLFLISLIAAASLSASELRNAVLLLATGKPAPEARSNTRWVIHPQISMATLHLQISEDASLAAQVASRAHHDSFGPDTTAPAAPADAVTYFAQVQAHRETLAANDALYEQVIQNAYRFVINRDAYVEEIAYWRERAGPFTYIVLVGCIEDWARRNQPGLMVTAGEPTISINCEFLATARLSPEDAADLRTLLGMDPPDDPLHRIIAPGSAAIDSSGGIHFVATGRH